MARRRGTPRFVAAAHARGVAVQPWTIDDPAQMRSLAAMHVDGINTDELARLLALLR